MKYIVYATKSYTYKTVVEADSPEDAEAKLAHGEIDFEEDGKCTGVDEDGIECHGEVVK